MHTNRSLTSSFTMWSILLFLGSIAMGGAVFTVTQAAKQHEAGIDDMNRSILAERQSIRVLNAEWAYLSRPQRLEELMAMKQDHGEMPPVPTPISTAVPDHTPVAQIETTKTVADIEPSAGAAVDIMKSEPKVETKPIKAASAKPEAAVAPKAKAKQDAVKTMPKVAHVQAPVKAAKASAAHNDDVWHITRKTAMHHSSMPSYRSTLTASRGGMHPIVE